MKNNHHPGIRRHHHQRTKDSPKLTKRTFKRDRGFETASAASNLIFYLAFFHCVVYEFSNARPPILRRMITTRSPHLILIRSTPGFAKEHAWTTHDLVGFA